MYVPLTFGVIAFQIVSNLALSNLQPTSDMLASLEFFLICVVAQLSMAISVLIIQRQVVLDMFGSNTLTDRIRKILALSTGLGAVLASLIVTKGAKGTLEEDSADFI